MAVLSGDITPACLHSTHTDIVYIIYVNVGYAHTVIDKILSV